MKTMDKYLILWKSNRKMPNKLDALGQQKRRFALLFSAGDLRHYQITIIVFIS
jgi:hypothetical protein